MINNEPYIDPSSPAVRWIESVLNEHEKEVIQAILGRKNPEETSELRGRATQIKKLKTKIEELRKPKQD